MNVYSQAQRAYSPVNSPARSARSTEFEVIGRISHRLRSAMKNDDYPALAAALQENNKLWLALGTDAADPDNLLPDELKARIVYLADFTRQHTHKVLRKQESAMPLLEINAAVLRGLKGEVPGS